jgi:DNA topoisomerase VI subunit B
MKLVENDHVLVSSGTDDGMSFGIRDQDMGVILGILRNKMYSDPIGSVVREITSNALDSHVVAGKADIPIRIELPTILCSEYRVIDYGLGMSPETVNEVFRNYGASTKRGSNDQIGGFGLNVTWALS